MPEKKKFETFVPEPDEDFGFDKKADEPKKGFGGCGFENKQYFSDSGRKMTCVLPNHAGDHAAPYPEEGADEKVLIGFSDAAGVPLDAATLKKLEAEKARKEAEKTHAPARSAGEAAAK